MLVVIMILITWTEVKTSRTAYACDSNEVGVK